MSHIAFCLPAYDGRVSLPWMSAFIRSINMLTAQGIKYDLCAVSGCGIIQSARADLVGRALDTDADTVLFIDGRQIWEPVGLLRLIADLADVDFVAAPVATDHGAFHCNYTGKTLKHLREASHCAIGFAGMRRELLETLCTVYSDRQYYDQQEQMRYDLFAPIITGAKALAGEDISFTLRAREAGYELWVDEGIKTQRLC